MSRKKAKIEIPRGVFEKVPGSGIYWIRFVGADGKYHREIAGNLSTAKARVEDRRPRGARASCRRSRARQGPRQSPSRCSRSPI